MACRGIGCLLRLPTTLTAVLRTSSTKNRNLAITGHLPFPSPRPLFLPAHPRHQTTIGRHRARGRRCSPMPSSLSSVMRQSCSLHPCYPYLLPTLCLGPKVRNNLPTFALFWCRARSCKCLCVLSMHAGPIECRGGRGNKQTRQISSPTTMDADKLN